MDKKIPKQFNQIFTNWDEYRDWSIKKSKEQLELAFKNDNNNRKDEITTS